MRDINVEGGWGNEAIEIGFWHANQEINNNQIDQIILIGDASPNTEGEVKEKRQKSKFGEKMWANSKFGNATDYNAQMKQLIEKKVPVLAFYVC